MPRFQQSACGSDTDYWRLTPGIRLLHKSNIEVSFVRGVSGAQAKVRVHSLRNGGTGVTLDINAGEAHLAASLSELGGALMGVAWVSITREQDWGRKRASMEVIIGDKFPVSTEGFEFLALLRLTKIPPLDPESSERVPRQDSQQSYCPIF